MNNLPPPAALTTHLIILSLVSFGGIPSALPDLRGLVVDAEGWVSDREFANYFAIVQAIPGPNMILMMSFIGWKVWGLPGAVVSALATFGPSTTLSFFAYRLWDRFRDHSWQRNARRGLAPVTIGLVTAGGCVMARAGDASWAAVALTAAAAALMLATRINILWILFAGGAIGGLGLL
jgi:chromate transporter